MVNLFDSFNRHYTKGEDASRLVVLVISTHVSQVSESRCIDIILRSNILLMLFTSPIPLVKAERESLLGTLSIDREAKVIFIFRIMFISHYR